MKIKIPLTFIFIVLFLTLFAQKTKIKKYKQLSCPEKWWVFFHPFVAKKALKISEYTQKTTQKIMRDGILKGNGNGGQIDAFRHTFWMANLTQEIGWRKAKKLGKAHEKGNYKDYKKRKLEDGVVPDKISSEMDLYNNNVGINLGKQCTNFELKEIVIALVSQGTCKIIKTNKKGDFLDCEGKIIPQEELKGKWENNKCLVNSDDI